MASNMIVLPVEPPIYPNTAALPTMTTAGMLAVVLTSPPSLYAFDGSTWQLLSGGATTAVTSVTGTINRVTASPSTGAVILTTPQDINTSAIVQFGQLSIGSAAIASAAISITSTTQGFGLPAMTTTQKNAIASPATGLLVYDLTLADVYVYNGTAWIGSVNSGVISARGTANQVLINGVTTVQTGALVFTLPQSIATSSAVQFATLALSATSNQIALGTTNILTITTSPTANRTFTIVDAASNTLQPLGSATANNWIQYIDSLGVQHLAQPAFTNISGTAAITQGGTGLTATPVNGQLLIGNTTGNVYGLATLTQGTGIVITNGASSITIAVSAAVVTSFTTNSGTATPVSNTVSITGGTTGLTTAASGNAISFAGVLAAVNGGSGLSTSTAYAPYCGGTLSGGTFQQASTGMSNSGWILTSTGSSSLPTWQAISTAVATSFITNSGTATPSANAITINGGTIGLTTVGSGSTVSLTGTLIVANGGTGLATFTTYAPICGGTTTTGNVQQAVSGMSNVGYVLTSTGTGSLPTWQASSTAGTVTSIIQTANQISASSTTGNVTLTLPNGISLGSYQATTPPTGGFIMPGKLGVGLASPDTGSIADFAGNINSTGWSIGGTGSNAYLIAQVFGRDNIEMFWDCYYNGTSIISTSSNGNFRFAKTSGLFELDYSSTTSGSAISFLTGITLSTAGNVGIGDPSPGSKLSVLGNAQIGFASGTAGPTNGLAVSGPLLVNETSRVGVNSLLQVNSANWNSSFTDGTNTLGIYLATGQCGLGTFNNVGLNFFTNNGGTQLTLATNNGVAFGSYANAGNTPPAGGLIIPGSVAVGTNTAAASALLTLTSTTQGFLQPRNSSPLSNISSPAEGLTAHNTTSHIPQWFNGTNWINNAGINLIFSSTVASVGSISWQTSTTNIFGQYKSLFVVIENFSSSVNSDTLTLLVSNNNGSTYYASGYIGGVTSNDASTGNTWQNFSSSTAVGIGITSNASTQFGYLYMGDFSTSGAAVHFTGVFKVNGVQQTISSFNSSSSSGYNAFLLQCLSGNIAKMTISVYGVYHP